MNDAHCSKDNKEQVVLVEPTQTGLDINFYNEHEPIGPNQWICKDKTFKTISLCDCKGEFYIYYFSNLYRKSQMIGFFFCYMTCFNDVSH